MKFIAFFLPQYHPFRENDAWWGKGFTEWRNVTRSEPMFAGHYQPHCPADLGFYDLKLRETRLDQIALAKSYGVDGFCYHYYWFAGKRLMHRPLDEMLADPESDMPFCLCWANENWTRTWDGSEHEILIRQNYSPDDDVRFIDDLAPFLRDKRYITIDGKPLLIVYRPQQMPDPKGSVRRWTVRAQQLEFPGLYTCAALTHHNKDYVSLGFDCAVQFPPNNVDAPDLSRSIWFRHPYKGKVADFADVAEGFLRPSPPDQTIIRCVYPSWDNTARKRERAFVTLNGTPQNYEYWLKQAAALTPALGHSDEKFVFINAWNEWAEGCHLEPDLKYGHQFLEATMRVKEGTSAAFQFQRGLPANALDEFNLVRGHHIDAASVWKQIRREAIRIVRQIRQGKKDVNVDDIPKY